MSHKDIIRAWKDEAFRANLGDRQLPENPAGQIELDDELLGKLQGGLLPPGSQVDSWCEARCLWSMLCSYDYCA